MASILLLRRSHAFIRSRSSLSRPLQRQQQQQQQQQQRVVVAAASTSPAFEHLQTWVRSQSLREVLPPSELAAAVKSLREDEALRASYRPTFDKAVERAEKALREETRTLGELLGAEASEKVLKALENVSGDADATRSFLRTPAVEKVVGSILYEGIFEFIKGVDLLGNIINGLPIIGPIRQQIMTGVKQELDRSLGNQVKGFLGGYSRLATEQLVTLVLSDENSKGFAAARRRLGEEILGRPVSSLVPSEALVAELKESAWTLAADTPLPSGGDEEVIERVYKLVGDESLEGLGIATPPQLSGLADAALGRFLQSEEGKAFIAEAAAAQK
jgi:hypothetical protein